MLSNIRSESADKLFKAILLLETVEECYNFFDDICTISEIQAFTQRFEVACMLAEKKTYIDIAKQTGASTATISRVNRSLQYGSGGYNLAFDKAKKKNGK